MGHWLQFFFGFRNGDGNGPYYLFWSGVGSDISEIAIFGFVVAFLRRHNCEVHGCWRLSRHTTAAGHGVCRRHHPDGAPTAQDVADAHTAALTGGGR